jgi:predicted secreted Zn-dependent protease
MRLIACLFALCLPAAAHGVEVDEIVYTYEVDEVSEWGLIQQMQADGPNGYWAYTEWFVRWTAECEVSVEIVYTLPEHSDPDAMDWDLRESWDGMLQALTEHEEQHGQHGLNAAAEIEAAECWGGQQIIDEWAQEDKIFDADTNHGALEGVEF